MIALGAGLVLAGPAHATDISSFISPRPSVATPGSFADLAEKLLPMVVNISSSQKPIKAEDMPDLPQFPPGSPFEDFFQDFMDRNGNGDPDRAPGASLGSGFIIDAGKGYIVTNNHVIKDAGAIRVTLHNDTTLDAKLIGADAKTDLAVLQVDPHKGKLVATTFGNSDVMRVGDWVLAIGNPFGLGGTVTAGIISARARDINSGPYDDFIQTDASINRGNSGGPMFNLKGEIIGINTAIYSPSGGSVGIGFAIPSNLARPVIDQIIKYGRTKRGWIGVRIQTVTDDIADSLGLGNLRGALVASVTPKGPAEVAGLKPGDIVTTYNGQQVGAMRNLPRLVAETPIETQSTLKVWRDGTDLTITVKVAELEKAEADGLVENGSKPDGDDVKGTEIPSLGLTLGTTKPKNRGDDLDLPDEAGGVAVRAVKKGSEAAEKGIEVGDIIAEVNQKPVTNPRDVARLVNAALAEGKTSILLLVDAGGKGNVRFVALKVAK